MHDSASTDDFRITSDLRHTVPASDIFVNGESQAPSIAKLFSMLHLLIFVVVGWLFISWASTACPPPTATTSALAPRSTLLFRPYKSEINADCLLK